MKAADEDRAVHPHPRYTMLFALIAVVALAFVAHRSFAPGIPRAVAFLTLSAISFGLAMHSTPIIQSLWLVCAATLLGGGGKSAAFAWREYGDRRMIRRAEEYQARVDAERDAA